MNYVEKAEELLARSGEIAQTTPTKLDVAAGVYAILAVERALAAIHESLEEIAPR